MQSESKTFTINKPAPSTPSTPSMPFTSYYHPIESVTSIYLLQEHCKNDRNRRQANESSSQLPGTIRLQSTGGSSSWAPRSIGNSACLPTDHNNRRGETRGLSQGRSLVDVSNACCRSCWDSVCRSQGSDGCSVSVTGVHDRGVLCGRGKNTVTQSVVASIKGTLCVRGARGLQVSTIRN
jgi:hypothetical protein